jgi:hypothetical protein
VWNLAIVMSSSAMQVTGEKSVGLAYRVRQFLA